jgi:hypothetical protein
MLFWILSKAYLTYEDVSKSFGSESITNYTLTTINTRWEATQRVMAAKLTRLTQKIATQLHLVAESCTVCSSCSRWPVRKIWIYTLCGEYEVLKFSLSDTCWNLIHSHRASETRQKIYFQSEREILNQNSMIYLRKSRQNNLSSGIETFFLIFVCIKHIIHLQCSP